MNGINSTICAISTPLGEGGVCIIRISGDDAVKVAQQVCTENLSEFSARFMARTKICYANRPDLHIDDAMVCVFRAPDSFTGENVVELHCHGGVALAKTVMNQLFSAGAMQAEAGEFTRRAFLNSKIDLTKAEAIGNIIHAQTEKAVNIAANSIGGAISCEIEEIRSELKAITAALFVEMDYEDDFMDTSGDWRAVVEKSKERLSALLKTADNGIIEQEGLNVAIVGAPNVGKSSLLNALLGENRAIVTEIAGTTRDVLRERANINGHLVNFIDTAGIRETGDVVEKIGIERAKEQMQKADLVICVLDASREQGTEDNKLLQETAGMRRIVVHNKSDIVEATGDLCISAKTGEGIAELCAEIAKECETGDIVPNAPIIANVRQKQQIQRALSQLSLENASLDAAVTVIESAVSSLGEIIGESVSDEIVEEIFSKFCVGK